MEKIKKAIYKISTPTKKQKEVMDFMFLLSIMIWFITGNYTLGLVSMFNLISDK